MNKTQSRHTIDIVFVLSIACAFAASVLMVLTLGVNVYGNIEKASDAATDFESFQKELTKLVTEWPPDKIAECIAVATFKARALGSAEFEGK